MNVTHVMETYFREQQRNTRAVNPVGSIQKLAEQLEKSTPIVVPNEKKWELLDGPEALQRLFKFDNTISLIYFLEDVIQLQQEMNHHGRILIDGLQVLIQINTKVMDRVTDLDVEWTRKVDEIYNDTKSVRI
jgi:pterin-4a-carbinolamine dehydratase